MHTTKANIDSPQRHGEHREKPRIEAELPAIRCPVLAIQGYDDRYGTMEQLDRIARVVSGPCELLKLANCGHAPQRDQPTAVIDAIALYADQC